VAERHGFSLGTDEHLRAVLECFDLKRLTTQVGTTLLEILERRIPYVNEFINRIPNEAVGRIELQRDRSFSADAAARSSRCSRASLTKVVDK